MADGNYTKLLTFINETLSLAINKSKNLHFDKKYPQHLYAICVYGRLLEMSIEFISLVSKKHFASSPILIRAINEIFVDFRNNLADPDYHKYMLACHEQNRRILLNYVLRYKDNPMFQLFYENIEQVKSEKKAIKTKLKELEKDGFKPLSVSQRFIKAGFKDEYNSIYQQLTSDVHNALVVVEEQCIEHIEGDYIVSWFPEYDVEDYWTYLDMLAKFLTEATINIHEFLENKDTEIIELGTKIEALRKSLSWS